MILADLQAALVSRLRTAPAVLALVSEDAIADGFTVPQRRPAISIGEDAAQAGEFTSLAHDWTAEVLLSIHIWTRGPGLVAAKRIVAAVVVALAQPVVVADQRCKVRFWSARFGRGPDDETQHATLILRTRVWEAA